LSCFKIRAVGFVVSHPFHDGTVKWMGHGMSMGWSWVVHSACLWISTKGLTHLLDSQVPKCEAPGAPSFSGFIHTRDPGHPALVDSFTPRDLGHPNILEGKTWAAQSFGG